MEHFANSLADTRPASDITSVVSLVPVVRTERTLAAHEVRLQYLNLIATIKLINVVVLYYEYSGGLHWPELIPAFLKCIALLDAPFPFKA